MSENITEFRRWRTEMGLTQDQAASMLGVTASQVKNWDAGEVRGRGVPSLPSIATRTLMAVLAQGIEVNPWPATVVRSSGKTKRNLNGE